MQLSSSFNLSHFDQPEILGFPAVTYPAQWVASRAVPLAHLLEVIQAELGEPITITSGYRSPELNRAMRAAGHPVARISQHCDGRAADFVVPRSTPTEVYAAALYLHQRGRLTIGGLGLYCDWVHVDIRPGLLTKWIG